MPNARVPIIAPLPLRQWREELAAAAWLQRADRSGSLSGFLSPNLTAEELGIAKIEGWILGVV
jgi:dihydroorotase